MVTLDRGGHAPRIRGNRSLPRQAADRLRRPQGQDSRRQATRAS